MTRYTRRFSYCTIALLVGAYGFYVESRIACLEANRNKNDIDIKLLKIDLKSLSRRPTP